ncbi:MAG TPA: hypothetical protein VMV19_05835 [Xanthobacteraceae bacterium]|nr:hypothetical protein [Xanthobacteraceae bacterium]
MANGRRFAAVLSAVIAAVAVVLIPSGPARAGGSCDLNDIWSALQNTLSTISSASCAGVTTDPALWAPVGVAAGVMAGVSQSQQFCQDVNNAQNQLTNVQGGGSSLVTQLGNLGVDASFLSSILDAMSSAADALAIVQCACGLSNNITQVGGDLGACVADALCDLQNLANQIDPSLFGSCSGSIYNAPTNCTQNPCNSQTGACDPNLGNVIVKCPSGDDAPPVSQSSSSNGVVVSSVLGASASGVITVESCICPAPMTGTWVTNSGNAQWSNIVSDPACQVFMCQCPSGTTLASNSGAGQYVCVCPNGRPAQSGPSEYNPDGLACPRSLTGPVCPQGQVAVGQTCVPACTSNEVRTPSGTCCNPNQVASCGMCCPAGMVPNPSNGTCMPNQITQ